LNTPLKKEKVKLLLFLFSPDYNSQQLNPDYVIGFVMSIAIARKSDCLEILA
jgi:hypothetical protein